MGSGPLMSAAFIGQNWTLRTAAHGWTGPYKPGEPGLGFESEVLLPKAKKDSELKARMARVQSLLDMALNFNREPHQKRLVDMNPHLNDVHQRAPH